MTILARLAVAFAFGLAGPVAAQLSPAAQEVMLLAPQLQVFAGSRPNFDSLAAGLRTGAEVTLVRVEADGRQQTARFTPAQPLSTTETARVLEAARQQLIAHGIADPGPQAIGIALIGGTLTTPSGPVKLERLVAPADPKKPLTVTQGVFAGSASNYKNLVQGLGAGGAVTLATPGKPTVSFAVPGGPLSAEEVKQTLQVAGEMLAAHGIREPTPQQLQAALVGGTVAAPSGATVQLRGVLQGRSRATSASPQTGFTSDTRQKGHTSDRPSTGFTSDSRLPPPPKK
jgi:hypothetical protein